MNNLFYFLPLTGALTGFFTALSLILLQKQLLSKTEMAPFIDKQLNHLISTFQQEIPMAGTFLKGKLLDKLKSRSEEELLKSLPELKEMLIKKVFYKFLFVGTLIGGIVGFLIALLSLS